MPLRIVIDTGVLVAAARSRLGASFALVGQVPSPKFTLCLSLPLYLEWQEVLTRPENVPPGLNREDVLGFLKFLARIAEPQEVRYSLRPTLGDPDDEMILELAFASRCQYIVTHNVRDFSGAERFGVQVVTPGRFLHII